MLKTRLLTAVILLLVTISGVLLLPTLPFAAASGSLFLLAAWEWTRLAGFTSIFGRLAAFCAIPSITLLILAILQAFGKHAVQEGALFLMVAFWIVALVILLRYPKDIPWCRNKIVSLVIGTLVLAPSWTMLVALQHQDPKLLLYVLGLICLADSGAYFVGKRFGRHKLLPDVSPGKTWEGVLGGMMTALWLMVLSFGSLSLNMSFLSWIVLGLATVAFSIVGDLFESFFKRMRNVKDSGVLLPGHGGVLDRIDSLTAAVPIFTVGFMFFS